MLPAAQITPSFGSSDLLRRALSAVAE